MHILILFVTAKLNDLNMEHPGLFCCIFVHFTTEEQT